MKISKIEFENFRNFKEKCCITFPIDGSVTVIYGPNGVGKTTLHQLFQWIFYGEVHFNKTASKEMFNLDFEQEAAVNKAFSVWGIIDFENPNSAGEIEKYSIRREWVYRKELKETKVVDRKIRISKDTGIAGKSNWVTLTTDAEAAAKLIEQILPSGLSQYFFFDGESMIADLGKTGKDSAKALRKALFSIFDLDIYEQATVHLGSQDSGSSTVLGKLYLSLTQNSSNKDIMLQTGEFRAATKRVEKLREEIESYKSYIEKYRKAAQDLSEKIGNAPSRKALEERRKRAKASIKALEESIASEMKAFGATVMSAYPHLLLSRVVEEAQFRIGLKIEDQKLPRGLTKELVLTLLDSDTCLCGHPITPKERQVLDVHQLRHDGKPRLLLGNLQQAQALLVQTLEVIRRGARLERAAAKQLRARGLDGLGDIDDLLLGFHGARPRDHGEMPAAELRVAHAHDGVVGVELAVAALERVGHALDGIDDIQTFQQRHIDPARIADQTQHGLILAERGMHVNILVPQPVDELISLFLGDVVLQYDNHGFDLQCNKKCGTVNSVPHGNYRFCASKIDLTI